MDGNSANTYGVAIIGAGERGVYYIGARMAESALETGLRIVGVQDRLADRARLSADHLNAIYASRGINHRVEVFADLDAAVTDPAVRLVLVTTHTNAHRAPVEAALAAGRHVYLDKPIAVTMEDALAIRAAETQAAHPVMMGFTRRYEVPWIEAVRMAHEGEIGAPQMILLRSVIPYTRYLQLWHREQALSGGALNDKGSHHFDVLNWIARSPAVRVSAQGGRSAIFTPDPDAPARCRDCDRDCPYRRHETLIDRAEGVARVPNESWVTADASQDRNDNCVYLPGSDIDDHAIVTVTYENGMVACLFLAIFGPFAEDQETLEIVGSTGRLRMERHSGAIDLVTAHGHAREVVHPDIPDRGTSHFGADLQLVRSLRRFLDGENPPVGVPEGIASLRLVLAAQASLRAGGRPVDPRTGDWA